jgi:competence protein ComEC
LTLIQEIKVKKIAIGKQFENSENYQELLKIAKEKKIIINVVEIGQKINIEKDLYFEVLWPDFSNYILENSINNNSLVCKLIHKNFSVLFTGDIEELAENKILKLYEKELDKLKSTILKTAHHGSKTSTSEGFLNAVEPRLALIGVGEDNKFGHPNKEIINRLKKRNIKIYRTDEDGEVIIKIDKCIKITNMVNNKTKEKSGWEYEQ